MNNKQDMIKSAILNKLAISFRYHGYYREACPHTMGIKNDKRLVLVYQFGGQSSSGNIEAKSKDNWRAMFLSEITELETINAEWQTCSNHSKPSNCFDYIEVEVEY